MTPSDQAGWLAERIAQTSDRCRESTCPRCHCPVLRARAGRIAALDVTADPEPIDQTAEILARVEGRLTWFLITSPLGAQRIAWRNPGFTPHAKHPVIRDHKCPPQPIQEALL